MQILVFNRIRIPNTININRIRIPNTGSLLILAYQNC